MRDTKGEHFEWSLETVFLTTLLLQLDVPIGVASIGLKSERYHFHQPESNFIVADFQECDVRKRTEFIY